MTMTSRNIANMHLFLEMKRKFPDLPEDTLRDYVLLYAQNKDECISLLQKQSKNHFHSSQLFTDFRLPEGKAGSKRNENAKTNPNNLKESPETNNPFLFNSSLELTEKPTVPVSSATLSHSPVGSTPSQSRVQLTSNYTVPPSTLLKSKPISSHITVCKSPKDENYNRMMFSTTQEHTILPLEPSTVKSQQTPIASTMESSKRHAVSLNITPSFPFSQQQMNVYSSAVCATTSHSSKPGRHTTSLNLQLRPHSSDPYPIEISTIPTNIGSPCKSSDYGSHLQISVGAQGATFTALRLQRPSVPPKLTDYLTSPPQSSEQSAFNPSSQAQNSNMYMFPNQLQVTASSVRSAFEKHCDNYPRITSVNDNCSRMTSDDEYNVTRTQNSGLQSEIRFPAEKLNAQTSFGHGFQASPDYMQAVKKHQFAQLDLVQEELNREIATLSNLKFEVNKLEQEVVQKREKKDSYKCVEALKNLKEENRKLRIECNCLLMEYDMCSKGQIPVGMTDEDFYSNIFTGPNDGLTFCSNDERSNSENEIPKVRQRSFEDDEEDERNRWRCKKCTFANHPALEKCEMCELPKQSDSIFDDR